MDAKTEMAALGLPWKFVKWGVDPEDTCEIRGGRRVLLEGHSEEAQRDFEFITRAANAYHEMLEVCRTLIRTDDLQRAIDLARAALAKYEVRS